MAQTAHKHRVTSLRQGQNITLRYKLAITKWVPCASAEQHIQFILFYPSVTVSSLERSSETLSRLSSIPTWGQSGDKTVSVTAADASSTWQRAAQTISSAGIIYKTQWLSMFCLKETFSITFKDLLWLKSERISAKTWFLAAKVDMDHVEWNGSDGNFASNCREQPEPLSLHQRRTPNTITLLSYTLLYGYKHRTNTHLQFFLLFVLATLLSEVNKRDSSIAGS